VRDGSILVLPTIAFANPLDILAQAPAPYIFEISLNGGWWLNGRSEKMSEWQAGEAIGALERMQKLIKIRGKHHET
jgi:hypothetical protein